MAEVSAKGMRRKQFANGRLHVFTDPSGVVLQLRTESVPSAEDTTATCCKMGILLAPAEVLELAGELLLQAADREKRNRQK
jgi:hypothetical protein